MLDSVNNCGCFSLLLYLFFCSVYVERKIETKKLIMSNKLDKIYAVKITVSNDEV